MKYVLVATNTTEQQEIMVYLRDKLKLMYHADPDVTVIQSGVSKIDILHNCGRGVNVAASYQVIVVPVSISLDKLRGYASDTNFNISRLLRRIDEIKTEVITAVNANRRKVLSPEMKRNHDALKDAVNLMFR
jgi:hypothetical protein